MRAQRQKIKLLKQAGADENDIISARCKYRALSAEYTDFCDKMNLPQERQRVYSDGLGNIGKGKTKPVANSENSGIIKSQKKITQIRSSLISEKINAGEYSINLSTQQYKKHIEGTPQFEAYKTSRLNKGGNPQSILLVDEKKAEEIIRKFAGTGIVRVDKNGNPKPIEDINCGFIVGKYFAKGNYINTTKVSIHYGKKKSHIVPIRGDRFD